MMPQPLLALPCMVSRSSWNQRGGRGTERRREQDDIAAAIDVATTTTSCALGASGVLESAADADADVASASASPLARSSFRPTTTTNTFSPPRRPYRRQSARGGG